MKPRFNKEMAVYSLRVSTMGRSGGRSSVAASAYRSGEKLEDERTGETHDYRPKGRAGVEASGITLPEGADGKYFDRETLWNGAEAAENRKNSRTAREVLVAIPHELPEDKRHELVSTFSQDLSDRYKTGVDYAIHPPSKHGDERNYHAHLMMTTREIDEDGFGAKTRQLDDRRTGPKEVEAIRANWEADANIALEKSGEVVRIDRRTLKEQGIDREPTVHEGVSATAIDRRSGFAERKALNTEIRENNAERIQLKTELKELYAEKKAINAELKGDFAGVKETGKEAWKAERLETAATTAQERAKAQHPQDVAKHDNYAKWHNNQIRKEADKVQDVNASEPQKRFWQSKNRHEAKHGEWTEKRTEAYDGLREKAAKHKRPEFEDTLDKVSGKVAFEQKVKKDDIKAAAPYSESRHGEKSALSHRTDAKREANFEARARLQENLKQRESLDKDINSRSAKLDKNASRAEQLRTKIEANKSKITRKDKGQDMEDQQKQPQKAEAQRFDELREKGRVRREGKDADIEKTDKAKASERVREERFMQEAETNKGIEDKTNKGVKTERTSSRSDQLRAKIEDNKAKDKERDTAGNGQEKMDETERAHSKEDGHSKEGEQVQEQSNADKLNEMREKVQERDTKHEQSKGQDTTQDKGMGL